MRRNSRKILFIAVLFALTAGTMVSLVLFKSKGETIAEWGDKLREEWENFNDRRRIAALVRRSTDATLVGVGYYLDGGSRGFIFTNQHGSFTVFLPHPRRTDVEVSGMKVMNQQFFLGTQNMGEDGIRIRKNSRLGRKLMSLAKSAEEKARDAETREYVETLIKVLSTGQVDSSFFPE